MGWPRRTERRHLMNARTAPVIKAGFVLGIGFGGFIDGIVLHQILQWHHMLTSQGDFPADTVAGLEMNTLWDGIFHASTWVIAFVGLWMLFDAADQRGVEWTRRTLLGAPAAGWGSFNLVEGLVDHHILGLHHVREDTTNVLAYDLGFLAVGSLLLIGGAMLIRVPSVAPESTGATSASR